MRYVYSIVCLALCLVSMNTLAVTVIVHPSNADAINQKTVKKIFLGKSKKFPGGAPVIPIDQTSGEAREQFLSSVVGKSESQLKAYWSKRIFTGKGQAPKAVDSDAEVIALVSANPNSIGYIADGSVDGTVKVVEKF